MFLLAATGGLNVGDMIAQLFFFFILISIVVGIVTFVVMIKQRKKQLNRIEEKLDQLIRREK
ncbi:hypothetical protein [Halobacillus litoralis]|uniref:hypothetical protein n=1 Tax=Halobacillus litoralis TaxID=45668 RepID=UPI00248FF7E9|nr:hypothetical protein [Halobacillus litoralis]